MTAHVATANRLTDGRVVYLGRDGVWSVELSAASVGHGPDEAATLHAAAERAAAAQVVVNPYLIEVAEQADGHRPLRLREVIRAGGPSTAAPTRS
jgi:hypothetical protein